MPDISEKIRLLSVTAFALTLSCALADTNPHPEQRWRFLAGGPEADGFSDADNEPMVLADGQGYFTGFDPSSGYEIWETDDSASGGAMLLGDLVPDDASSYPGQYQVLGSLVLFTAEDASMVRSLWRTDGTEAGTYPLTTTTPSRYFPGVVFQHRFYYLSESGAWRRTDGSVEGTEEVPGGEQIAKAGSMAVSTNGIFLTSRGEPDSRLFFYDGSGLQPVKTFTGEAGAIEKLSAAGSHAVFLRRVRESMEVWSSDGTEAGTVRLKSSTYAGEGWLVSGGELAWFDVYSDAGDPELWRTDGTPEGTFAVKAGSWESVRLGMRDVSVAAGSLLLFRVQTVQPSGQEIWETWLSEGSAETTSAIPMGVPDASTLPARMLAAGTHFYVFKAGYDGTAGFSELWNVDAVQRTARRTMREAHLNFAEVNAASDAAGNLRFRTLSGNDVVAGRCTASDAAVTMVRAPAAKRAALYPTGMVSTSRGIFFTADSGRPGWEPWVSNATTAGTRMIKDMATQRPWPETPASSFPGGYTEMGGRVFFQARNDLPATGSSLWSTDGTEAGTARIELLSANAGSSLSARMQVLGGNRLVFRNPGSNVLLTTDGTPGGLMPLAHPALQSAGPAAVNSSRGWLLGTTAAEGLELWMTEGTEATTRLVRDINPGPGSSLTGTRMLAAGDFLYFVANDGVSGRELWESDGTEDGTKLVADLAPGIAGSEPEGMHVMGDSLYFVTRASPAGQFPVWRLWRWLLSGGEPLLLAEVPMAVSSPNVKGSASANGRWCVFLPSVDEIEGSLLALWSSDGTPQGTRRLDPFPAGKWHSNLRHLTSFQGALYFSCTYTASAVFSPKDDTTWRTDGTPEGTWIVHFTGFDGPAVEQAVVYGSRLVGGADNLYVLNTAPASAPEMLLRSEGPDAPLSISVSVLAAAGAWSDPDGDAPGYRVSGVESGTLLKDGHPVAADRTTLRGTATLTWIPPAGARGIAPAFRVTAWDGQIQAGESSLVNVNIVNPPVTYDEWADSYGLTGEDRSPLAAPHGDRVANLIKCALGLSPFADAGTRLPVLSRASDSGSLHVEILRAASLASALSVTLEESRDLENWTLLPIDWNEAVSTGSNLQRLTVPLSVPAGENRFIRLRVKQNDQ